MYLVVFRRSSVSRAKCFVLGSGGAGSCGKGSTLMISLPSSEDQHLETFFSL
jgi:hypothetical protein